jgi:tRNA nucleotidyltransferase (CCA-adding enzyme)
VTTKIITTHERADMDAVASLYAAALLYPDHKAVLPSKLNRNAHEFVALYKDELPFIERRQMSGRPIVELLLVDTQAVAPMQGMNEHTRIRIIDHHPRDPSLDESVLFQGDPIGATSTLLIEELRKRDLSLTRAGALLLLMGIYEDTGSLSYSGTTARDVQAAAWLLDQGADLDLLNEFLNRPLSHDQREALTKLLENAEMHTIRGRSVCLTMVRLDRYVDELSTLVHQIMDVYEPDACLMLAQHAKDVQVIARSSVQAIDVGALLRQFGGGGHSKAAAALLEKTPIERARSELLAALEQSVEPPVLVREIMSTNVHTLGLDMSVRDAAQLMQRYGHEGFPVVESGCLVGILTRRDIDRALHHRLGDAPVRNFLHSGPAFVRPQDAVDEVQRVMVEHDLGQVPVVDEGRFVGIVTRTDLIKLWSVPLYPSRAQELRRKMEEALPDGLRELLIRARDVADDLGYSLYIVGGFVRDLLLDAPTLDLDLVVEGDALQLARRLASQLGGRMRSHARFGTAKLILDGDRARGVPPSLDFVTARTEFYERPTVLPEVERSSIKQDLYRRDFTINTMAICLDRVRYGELLDFYGGERDLKEGRIRVLHNLSFVEDPTRILRAVRFEQRLGFVIEARTAELLDDAIELLDDVSGERLYHELSLLLCEARPELGLERLERMGVLSHLHPSLRFDREMAALFVRLRERFGEWPGHGSQATLREGPGEACSEEEAISALALSYLAVLTSGMGSQELGLFVEHLHVSSSDARFLREVGRLRESLSELMAKMMLPSSIYRLLHPFSREALFVLSVLTDSELVRERLDLYERKLARVEPAVDGHYLRSLEVPPGPAYGEILTRVRYALLDEQATTIEEQQRLARSLVETLHGRRAHH